MHKGVVASLLGAVLSIGFCTAIQGQTISAATFVVVAKYNSCAVSDQSGCVIYNTQISPGVVTASNASGAATTNLTLAVSGSAPDSNPGVAENSSGQIDYYYAVEGPNSILVPLIVSGNATTAAAGAGATAEAYIEYGAAPFYACSPASCAGGIASGNLNASYSVESNTSEHVQLFATGDSYGNTGGGSYSASISPPAISIDPTWSASNPGYVLVFSSNVIPPTAASGAASADGPIPLWALGALGAGLLGVASRRLTRAA
jgi:hypothetical protein